MKKLVIFAVFTIIAIVAGIFTINFLMNNDFEENEKVKVGVIMCGDRDDRSWSQSHYEALEETKKQLDVEMLYRDSVPYENGAEAIDSLAAEGCSVIICNSFNYGESIQAAAEKYPDIYFLHASGMETDRNLSSYFGRMYQIRYLSGIVAGLQTETNEIGYVAAFPVSEVNRGINAFALGVRLVNPEASVYVTWCNSWTDDALAEAAAKKLVDTRNIDVLAMHTDSVRPLEIADENGIGIIGYNIDNSVHYPDTYLTSAVWDWESYYTPTISDCIQHKFTGEHTWSGISSGMISLAPLTANVKSGTQEIVDRELDRLYSGLFDVFYGPVRDKDRNVRIKEGENMSDDCMLNEFDWYVEGVEICE